MLEVEGIITTLASIPGMLEIFANVGD